MNLIQWIFFKITNFFYRINIIIKISFNAELGFSALQGGIYLSSLIMIILRALNKIFFKEKFPLILSFLCLSIFAGFLFYGHYLVFKDPKFFKKKLDEVNATNKGWFRDSYVIFLLYSLAL